MDGAPLGPDVAIALPLPGETTTHWVDSFTLQTIDHGGAWSFVCHQLLGGVHGQEPHRTVMASRQRNRGATVQSLRWERRLPSAPCILSVDSRIVVPPAGVLRGYLTIPLVHRLVGVGQEPGFETIPIAEYLPHNLQFAWRTPGDSSPWTEITTMEPGQSNLGSGRLCWRLNQPWRLQRPDRRDLCNGRPLAHRPLAVEPPLGSVPPAHAGLCIAPLRLINRAENPWDVRELVLEFDGGAPRRCREAAGETQSTFFAPPRRVIRSQDGAVTDLARTQPDSTCTATAPQTQAVLASKPSTGQHAHSSSQPPSWRVTQTDGPGATRVFGGGAARSTRRPSRAPRGRPHQEHQDFVPND